MAALAGRADWNDYRVFAAVARAKSFRGASRLLGTAAQALSMRVAQLEQKLGIKLLRRMPQGIELTRAGARVLGFVEVAESSLARADSVGRESSDTIEGECRVALGDGMGTYWFPRFAPVFGRRYPRIALHTYTSTRRLLDKTPSHDILVQYSDTLDEKLIATRAATLHFLLFASRDYLEAYGVPYSLEELHQHRLVDFTLPDTDRGMFASLRGLTDRTLMTANAVATQCEAIRWGAGIGLLPSYSGFVHDNLVPILTSHSITFPVYLCYERNAAKQLVVRATLNFLRDVVFDRSMPWFSESYTPPQAHWPQIMRACMDRAELLTTAAQAAE